MSSRWLAFVVSAVVAVGAGIWALRLFWPADSPPARSNMADPPVPAGVDLTRAVGVDLPPAALVVAPVATAGRFKLVGVVAPGVSASPSEGFALIAVDGQPARMFRVGATVEGDIVLRDVSANGATLGPSGGGTAFSLEVSLAPAAGTAPVPAGQSGALPQILFDGSAQAREVLRNIGSKYPPLAPQKSSAPQKPVDKPGDPGDGSWPRPSAP